MDINFKNLFLEKWNKYFPNADLPVIFYYTDEINTEKFIDSRIEHRCLINQLLKVRDGSSVYFEVNSIGCTGGRRYLGFSQKLRNNFDYFLSCGIEGELKGERYKKSPEIVNELVKLQPPFDAPGKFIVFKRWDKLNEIDEPIVVIFFANPDVLSGLFTLEGYDESRPDSVIVPFSSGCSSIVYQPYREARQDNPKAVLGMFDVSARPFVSADTLSFSVPMKKFVEMVYNMDESFLITDSWGQIKRRIGD
jgi:uncharacterized protein (DUF169 family)